MRYSNRTVIGAITLKFVEQMSVKMTSLIISIVLARLLAVEDFGVIAILTVFIHLFSAVIEGGLSTSLVQKKEVNDIDYSTVFYASMILATVLYGILFLIAPAIATAYENNELIIYLRVLGVALFVTPFNSVQLSYVYRNMLFRRMLIASLTAAILSGAVGIIGAYLGLGAWALILHTLLNSIIIVIMLLMLTPWKPKVVFSIPVLCEHLRYGWKLLCSSILDTLYNEMRTLVVGKKYNSDDLAYYNRGDSYPKLVMTSLNASFQTVMLPVLSSEQSDMSQLKKTMRKSVAASAFVLFPMMAGFAAVAENFVSIVLTDKWLPCVPYLQLSCFIYAVQPINSCNLQAVKAIGRSDVYLYLDLVKKALGFIILFVAAAAFQTPMAIAISTAIYAPVQLLINAYPNRKLIGYSFGEQLKDIALPLIMSVLMFTVVYMMNNLSIGVMLEFILQIMVGVLIYVAFSFIFRHPIAVGILTKIRKRG